MAEVTNAYVEATGRTTTTSTTVGGANKVRLTHTPGDNETWAYLWDSIVDCSSTGSDVLMRLRNETLAEDWANVNVEPKDGTNRMSVGGLKVKTYGTSPGSQDIDIDFWAEAASTVGAGGTFLWGLLLGADDKSAADDSQQNDSSGDSTFVTALTLTETLTGDYLFLCSCEYQVGALANILIRADKSGTKYGDFQARLQDTSTWRTWATGFKLTGLSGSQTVTIEFATELDLVQASVRKCRILAIKLDRFNKNGYQEDRTRDTNNTSTPEDQSSLAFTPDATRNHIAIAGMILDHNINTTNGFGEFERDGTAINQCQEEPQQNGDCFAFFSLRRESLSAATTYKTQKWSETTNITGAAESWIIVIDLEEAATGLQLDADAGAYALNGTASAIVLGRSLVLDAGVYTLAGSDADLVYGAAIELVAEAGSYAVNGTDALLTYSQPAHESDQPTGGWSGYWEGRARDEIRSRREREREELELTAQEQRRVDRTAAKIARQVVREGLIADRTAVMAAPPFDALLSALRPTEGMVLALADAILRRVIWMAEMQQADDEAAIMALLMEL